jgi:hypothetical protein
MKWRERVAKLLFDRSFDGLINRLREFIPALEKFLGRDIVDEDAFLAKLETLLALIEELMAVFGSFQTPPDSE